MKWSEIVEIEVQRRTLQRRMDAITEKQGELSNEMRTLQRQFRELELQERRDRERKKT